ncbi:MAG: hypothetical protein U0572_01740 [Phycisphaerales bacterium]
MRMSLALVAAVASGAVAASVSAAQFVDTFESSSSAGGWTFGLPPVYPHSGGNPGAYLKVTGLDTFAPQPRTTGASVFTGDYRAKRVATLGVDLLTIAVDFSAADRPCTLILVNNNGTPSNPNDDWGVYVMGPNIPLPGQGWKSFTFDIPYESPTLPPNWHTIQFGASSPTPDWNTVIKDVDQVVYFYGDPEFFFIFQMWTLGCDNARITTHPEDLDGDGSVGASDLGILLGAWGTSGPGDLDGDGVVGATDLGLLLGAWG